MKNLVARIQLPSGGFIDVTPESARPIIEALLKDTELVPELATSLWLEFSAPNGQQIQVILSPVPGLPEIVEFNA